MVARVAVVVLAAVEAQVVAADEVAVAAIVRSQSDSYLTEIGFW